MYVLIYLLYTARSPPLQSGCDVNKLFKHRPNGVGIVRQCTIFSEKADNYLIDGTVLQGSQPGVKNYLAKKRGSEERQSNPLAKYWTLILLKMSLWCLQVRCILGIIANTGQFSGRCGPESMALQMTLLHRLERHFDILQSVSTIDIEF